MPEVPNRLLNTHLQQTRSLMKQNSRGRPWIPEENVYLIQTKFIFTKSNIRRSLKHSTPQTKTRVRNTFHKRLKLYAYKIQITGNLTHQLNTYFTSNKRIGTSSKTSIICSTLIFRTRLTVWRNGLILFVEDTSGRKFPTDTKRGQWACACIPWKARDENFVRWGNTSPSPNGLSLLETHPAHVL